jgi:hypothetical protein
MQPDTGTSPGGSRALIILAGVQLVIALTQPEETASHPESR